MESFSGPPWITNLLWCTWKRIRLRRSSRWTWAFFLSVIVLCHRIHPATAEISDGCDWTGSGLDSADADRGVQPVYLRCSQGSVSWLYPHGAVRVVLRYGTAGKEFQGCLKLSPEFRGANVYVEQHRTLRLLHSGPLLEPRSADKLHCFDSHNGQAAIFIEADPGSADSTQKQAAKFTYDLQPRTEADSDPWEDCRPCTDQETLDLFCSSDFVARGYISAIYNDEALDRTVLTVRASRVIRQVSDVFTEPKGSKGPAAADNRLVRVPSKWKGIDGVEADLSQKEGGGVAQLQVPLRCRAKHGQGEFLFMGRKRLGDNVLWCAPRLEDWADLLHRARRDNLAQCVLES